MQQLLTLCMLLLLPCMLVMRARLSRVGESIFIMNAKGVKQSHTLSEMQATRVTPSKARALWTEGLLPCNVSRPTF